MKPFPTDFATLLAIVLVTYRLSRLLAVDGFPPARAFREWVARKFGEESSWSYLIECMHCNSWWLALVTGAVAWQWGHNPVAQFIAVALSASAIVGLVADNLIPDE